MERELAESINVVNNSEASRFEAQVGNLLAVAEYLLDPVAITFTHTRVPAELGGRGIATRLIEAGLDFARERGLEVIPLCSFVAAYMRKHPQVQDLLGAQGRKLLAPDSQP
jgi:predicted GNAT family acetyltransferase